MIDEDELTKKLNHLFGTGAHRVILNIFEYEKLHTKKALGTYGGYIKHFEDSFGWMNELLEYVNYFEKKHWPRHRTFQFLIMIENLSGLYQGFNLLVKGHYYEAITILRSTYEAIIKIIFLSYNPDVNPYDILFGKSIKGKKQFQLSNFLEHQLCVDWKFIWNSISSIAHSKNYRVITRAIEIHREGQKGPVSFELRWDQKTASIPMNLSYFCMWLYYILYRIFFATPAPKELPEDYYSHLLQIEEVLGEIVKSLPNKYSEIFHDVIRISDELLKKENIDYQKINRAKLVNTLRAILTN